MLKVKQVKEITGFSHATISTVKRMPKWDDYCAYKAIQVEKLNKRRESQKGITSTTNGNTKQLEILENPNNVTDCNALLNDILLKLANIESLLAQQKEKKGWLPLSR